MARRRKKQAQARLPIAEMKQSRIKATGLIISIVFTLILGGIPFGLGKYIELNSPGPFDSGAYVYSANHLLDGAKMGIDEMPSARPGTLIANLIGVKLFGFNDVGPKIVQMTLQLAALIFVFITTRKIFGSVASVISVAIMATYLSAPLIAKYGNVKEQFMIAYMVSAACSFIWYSVTQKKYWLILAGFFALQPYYFKPTGMSIVFAIVLYILIVNTLLRKWKSLWIELLAFLGGYAAGLVIPGWLFIWQGCLTKLLKTFPPIAVTLGTGILILTAIPLGLCVWAEKKNIEALRKVPGWLWGAGLALILVILVITQWNRVMTAAGLKSGGYLTDSIAARGLDKLAPQIFRYYRALSVPMLGALASVIAATIVWVRIWTKKSPKDIQSKIVWMLAAWWFLDVAFVWISPRSYEQYYLPLCASGAMLSGYIIWKWQQHFAVSLNKMPWLAGGLAAVTTLGCLSIPIFIGQRYSPDTGADYIKMRGTRQRGFAPALKELPDRQKGAWLAAGDYIRTHSDEKDTMYVWGWYPGIYVQAQRMAPVSQAFESNMHVTPPDALKRQIEALVNTMKQSPPKFIVDSRKRHFPNDRPPLELWPTVPPKTFGNENARFLKNNPQEVAAFNTIWSRFLESNINPDEAKRYNAMEPFRDFVMTNYRIVAQYGNLVLFELIES